MNVVLLDTNIVSFLLKADSRVQSYEPYLPLVTHNPTDFEIIEELELVTTVT